MAYMSQKSKQQLTPAIKAILKKYQLKATLSVKHHSTLVLNIKSGAIDFIGNQQETAQTNNPTNDYRQTQPTKENYIQVNPYWYHQHFSGQAKDCLHELLQAMNIGNHNNSRPEIDYFDVGWYTDINIGQWNKPYEYTA